MNKPTALVICPHPDDGEMGCGEFCIQAINADWNVHELLMTTDEYGTTRNDFKGDRIKAIRKNEMIRAARRYGLDKKGDSKLKLHWANYIDGFVPCNMKSIIRLQKFILKIKPSIIIGPDPFAYYDAHKDHIATGKNFYFALKWMNPVDRPQIMLFYYSYMPDFFVPSLSPETLNYVRRSHKSQWSGKFIKFFGNIQKFLYTFRWIKNTGARSSEGYRTISFNTNDLHPKGFAKILFQLIKYTGYDERHFIPTPQELNLNLHPEGDIE